MNLMPLMDRRGDVTAWADPNSGWVGDQMGKVFALVWFDGVFNQRGAQIGGWYGDHIRDRYGRVVLVRPGTKIEDLNMPRPNKIPRSPMLYLPSTHPALKWLPTPVSKKHYWAVLAHWTMALGDFGRGRKKRRAFNRRLVANFTEGRGTEGVARILKVG